MVYFEFSLLTSNTVESLVGGSTRVNDAACALLLLKYKAFYDLVQLK